MVCKVVPIAMRINLTHILVDKQAGGPDGYHVSDFKVEENETVRVDEKLDFADEELYLWITPGHYNLLYERNYWRKVGSKIEKAIEKLCLTRAKEEQKEMKKVK